MARAVYDPPPPLRSHDLHGQILEFKGISFVLIHDLKLEI